MIDFFSSSNYKRRKQMPKHSTQLGCEHRSTSKLVNMGFEAIRIRKSSESIYSQLFPESRYGYEGSEIKEVSSS